MCMFCGIESQLHNQDRPLTLKWIEAGNTHYMSMLGISFFFATCAGMSKQSQVNANKSFTVFAQSHVLVSQKANCFSDLSSLWKSPVMSNHSD